MKIRFGNDIQRLTVRLEPYGHCQNGVKMGTFLGELLRSLPGETAEIILRLIVAAIRLVRAGDDDKAQEDALMKAQEDIKEELDRRKFG